MDHQATWQATHMPIYGTPELCLVEGHGAKVKDAQGRWYTDLLAGLAVNILGHAHPAVVQAVHDQITTLGHVSNLYATPPALRLAQRLSKLSGGYQAALVNSGSEANELALKLARRHAHATDRPDGVVLAFEGSFHGRTMGSLALTGQPGKHEGFHPLPGGILHVPYDDPAALEEAFHELDVVAVFAEYIQGEGGIQPMPEETAVALGQLTREHDAVLVADEVQTGLGRTGALFAHEHYGHRPDVITLAKALGGGLPVGATLARPGLAERMGPGSHGCTFGGNPVACAAANAVLDVYIDEQLGDRARVLGQLAREILEDDHDVPVRGLGLLLGIPLDEPEAGQVVSACQAEGVLVGQAGDRVVRLAPPIVVQGDHLIDALHITASAVVEAT